MLTLPHRGRPLDWIALTLVLALGAAVARAENPADKKPDGTTTVKTADEKATLDQKLMAEIKDHSQIMKNLGYLSDVIGPRLTGSANLERANKWTAEKMKAYGLSNVHLEQWEIPVGWERGTVSMKLIDPGEKTLVAASAGWSPGMKGKIVGEVVILDARTKADLEKYKGKLKNAIILRGPPTPIAPVTDTGTPYGGPAVQQPRRAPAPAPADRKEEAKKDEPAKKDDPKPEAKKDETAKKDTPAKKEEPKVDAQPPQPFGGGRFGDPARFAEMQAFRRELNDFLKTEGAAAVLTDAGKPHGLLNMTGNWREGDRGDQTEGPVTLFTVHEHYALLYRLVTQHKLKPKVELEVTNKFTPGPVAVYNTVGDLPGSEKPDEFVILGAHLDSWDLGSGTTDNGTGSCVVLECARALGELAKQGIRPKRTIRFILFTGEEEGLHGSKQYVKKHESELGKISVALVHDTGTGKVTGLGLLGRSSVQKLIEPELGSLKDIGFEGLSMGGLRGGTDHWSFDQAGVPGFACIQQNDEYRFTHHTQSDTFDKAKEPNLVQGTQVMAVAALRVANLPELLPRDRPPQASGGGRRRGGEEPKKDEPKKDEKKPEEKKG
jgi:hypothetical protein